MCLFFSSPSSPAGISKVVTDVIQSISPDIADMLLPAYHQALAMANLVLEQIEQALESEFPCLLPKVCTKKKLCGTKKFE